MRIAGGNDVSGRQSALPALRLSRPSAGRSASEAHALPPRWRRHSLRTDSHLASTSG